MFAGFNFLFVISLLQEGYNEYALSTGNACLALAKYDEVWNYDLADGGDFRLKFIKTIDDWYTDHMPLKNIRRIRIKTWFLSLRNGPDDAFE